MKSRILMSTCAFVLLIAGAVAAQQLDTTKPAPQASTALANSSSDISVSGKVVSSTRTELVIETDAGQRMTFALDPAITPATTFTAGERVAVKYHSSGGGTVYQASGITVEPATELEQPAGQVTTSDSDSLPETASALPLIVLLGLLAMFGALAVRMARS
jgi:hypothetical protein